jgi:hypothetical protein
LAKDKKKREAAGKKDKKAKKAKAKPVVASTATAAAPENSKVVDAVRTAKRKATDLASNPAVAEVVAATLVAAAAALRNPQKARELAASARDELTAAGKAGTGQGNAFWQLALDVARRSVDTLGSSDTAKRKGKAKGKSAE